MKTHETTLELTVKSVIIGIVLAMLLCGANIYLGLKIGNTISASIPASILSLGILRLFKKYSILENNISQTIASSGEALAGVFAFVLPSLVILGIWHTFPYWEEFILGVCGGFIGVVFSVILRKVLLNDKDLTFPEGQAIGKVLLATNSSNADSKDFGILLKAIGIAGLINFCQNGLQILSGSMFKAFSTGQKVFGYGVSFSPAVLGAGFLIGSATVVAFIGSIIAWLILLPYFSFKYGIHNPDNLVASAFYTWKTYVRPVGVGVFIFGGVSTIVLMAKTLVAAIKESFHAISHINDINSERDLNIKKLLLVALVCLVPIVIFLFNAINALHCCSPAMSIIVSVVIILLILALGFVVAAVAGYLVGMVGSSNSPISGLYFMVVIILSVIMKLFLGTSLNIHLKEVMMIIVSMVAFIAFSGVITNENIQDYKSGQMVGATPYKQQLALFIGVFFSMLIAPIMINLIFNAYGIGGVVPHPGINPDSTLSAPQASAIASLTKHLLDGSESWELIGTGIGIGAIAFIINLFGKKSGKFSCSPIMIALGLYLPPDLIVLLFVGGLLKMIVDKRHAKMKAVHGEDVISALETRGSILVCGLIAGESLMGLFLAIPFIIKQSSDALKIVGSGFGNIADVLSILVTLSLIYAIYRASTKVK